MKNLQIGCKGEQIIWPYVKGFFMFLFYAYHKLYIEKQVELIENLDSKHISCT